MNDSRQRLIGEFDRSIIELSKRKLKLIQELNDINESISFYRQQQDKLTANTNFVQNLISKMKLNKKLSITISTIFLFLILILIIS